MLPPPNVSAKVVPCKEDGDIASEAGVGEVVEKWVDHAGGFCEHSGQSHYPDGQVVAVH